MVLLRNMNHLILMFFGKKGVGQLLLVFLVEIIVLQTMVPTVDVGKPDEDAKQEERADVIEKNRPNSLYFI